MAFIEKRSIGMAIVLCIVTCGIYAWFWVYKVWDSLYKANDMPSNAGTDLLLSLVTCGIYYIYMYYKAGKLEASAFARHGLQQKDDSVMYVLLAVFGFWVISLAILQSNINSQLADAANNANFPQQNQQY